MNSKSIHYFLVCLICAANSCKPSDDHKIDYRSISAMNVDSTVNMIVEIPSGTTAKFELNKESYTLEMDSIDGAPRHIKYLGYPGNYGLIPNTLMAKDIGGDGDPLDVLLLGPALKRGLVVPVRLIGVLKLLDNGEKDDKLLAILPDSHWTHVQDVSQLDSLYPGTTEIISTFFENYKGKNQMELMSILGRSEAIKILESSVLKK